MELSVFYRQLHCLSNYHLSVIDEACASRTKEDMHTVLQCEHVDFDQALAVAYLQDFVEFVVRILRSQRQLTFNSVGPILLLASYNGQTDIVQSVVDTGWCTNQQFTVYHCVGRDTTGPVASVPHTVTPLWFAAKNERLDVIRVLLAAGADVDMSVPRGTTLFIELAKRGALKSLEVLLTEDNLGVSCKCSRGTGSFCASNLSFDIHTRCSV